MSMYVYVGAEECNRHYDSAPEYRAILHVAFCVCLCRGDRSIVGQTAQYAQIVIWARPLRARFRSIVPLVDGSGMKRLLRFYFYILLHPLTRTRFHAKRDGDIRAVISTTSLFALFARTHKIGTGVLFTFSNKQNEKLIADGNLKININHKHIHTFYSISLLWALFDVGP